MRNDSTKHSRRNFMKSLGTASVAVAAAAALPLADAKADSETPQEKRKARYKETDHVKAYYRTNRY